VANLLKDGWITEIDADHPARIFGTRRPDENDQLQVGLFDGSRQDEDGDDSDSDEGDDE
jgi:hypothetical protein